MKKLLLATSAIVAFAVTAPAGAADMRVKAAPVYKPACANFGGWFVNGHVGWGRYEYDWNNRDAWGRDFETDIPLTIETSDNGFAGGVGIGFNWQPSCVLFGVDLDYDWASITANKFHTDGNEEETLEVSSKLRGFGTLRVRSGLVVENLLLYVTGGLAWGSFDRNWVFNCADECLQSPIVETFSHGRTRWGSVVGFGTEWDWGASGPKRST